MGIPRKIQCEVTEVRRHGERIYGVSLKPQGRLPRFSAGQFLHLTLDEYDPASFWPESRVFSIASSPEQTRSLEILYSVKGRYTARMEQELCSGKMVWVKLPYGDFRFDEVCTPRVLFAGGTGIAAFSSLLNAIHSAGEKAPVKLVYGIRNEALFFYRDMVEAIAEKGLCEKIILFIEHGVQEITSVCFSRYQGRISMEAIFSELYNKPDVDSYLAGPPAMLNAIMDTLRSRNIPDANIHLDEWE